LEGVTSQNRLKICPSGELDFRSISIFVALGFFLEDRSFKRVDQKSNSELSKSLRKYNWKYVPLYRSFENVMKEFFEVFSLVTKKLDDFERIILPISGGLDSRSQAALLKGSSNVTSYTYSFQDGINENEYGRLISNACNFHFNEFTIPSGYLWNKMETLAEWNKCESEFTHPRQMAIESEFPEMGDVFFLGHWGDVLFDSVGIDEKAGEEEQVAVLKKKIVKKGGIELGEALWEISDFPGTFSEYLDNELHDYLSQIKIDHPGAKIRAFKSLHWLPRWTLANLCVFERHHPVVLPYCDTRMFDFICTVPEEYLAGRKIQIEYIKQKAPELAAVPWQPYAPQNLYNYHQFGSPKYWPKRGWKKLKRVVNTKIKGKMLVQRNWELQFLEKENDRNLRSWLFENQKFTEWVPLDLVKEFYNLFQDKDPVYYSHPISMLLTLSVFSKQYL